jgi:hypothetical protein
MSDPLPSRFRILSLLLPALVLFGCGRPEPVHRIDVTARFDRSDDGEHSVARLIVPAGGELEFVWPADRKHAEIRFELRPVDETLPPFEAVLEPEEGTHSTRLDFSPLAGELVELRLKREEELGIKRALPSGAAWWSTRAHTPVVLIVVDTLRADVVENLELPHIHGLADEGLYFPRAFAHAPMTLPSHTALFASRYPHVTRVTNNGQTVDSELPLLADWLASAGYRTDAAVSLGTLWPRPNDEGVTRGFDAYDRSDVGVVRWPTTHASLEERIGALDPEQPFFLFAHYTDPHEPYTSHPAAEELVRVTLDGEPVDEFDVSEALYWERELAFRPGKSELVLEGADHVIREMSASVRRTWLSIKILNGGIYEGRARTVLEIENHLGEEEVATVLLGIADEITANEKRARYVEEVLYVDDAIGALVAELKERDLWDRSLVIFTSDHGENLGEFGGWGHAEWLTDSVLRVPLAIKLPAGDGRLEQLSEVKRGIVRHKDLVPTVLELLDLPPLPGQMGVSLLDAGAERLLLAETHKPEASGDRFALRDEEWKLLYDVGLDQFLLYDLEADPFERTDVFDERGHEVGNYKALLHSVAKRWQDADIDLDDRDEETERLLRGLGY